MQRDIITTISFNLKNININVIENIADSKVELFNRTCNNFEHDKFFKKSLNEINEIIGAQVNDVIVIVEDSKQDFIKIITAKNKMRIAGEEVTKEDIENLLVLVKNNIELKEANKKVTFIQPLIFSVTNNAVKEYLQAPYNKSGSLVEVVCSVTMIANELIKKIRNTLNKHSLNVTNILLKSQTITQNNISRNALEKGSVLVHFDQHRTYLTINKHKATILCSHFDFSAKKLEKVIARKLKLKIDDAHKLLFIHGSLKQNKNNYLFFGNFNNINNIKVSLNDLNQIIKEEFHKTLLLINSELRSKGVNELPIILSGELTKIDHIKDFAMRFLDTSALSIYKPMNFVEINPDNWAGIGAMNLLENLAIVLNKKQYKLVETNPDSITKLIKTKTHGGFLSKFLARIGEQYGK